MLDEISRREIKLSPAILISCLQMHQFYFSYPFLSPLRQLIHIAAFISFNSLFNLAQAYKSRRKAEQKKEMHKLIKEQMKRVINSQKQKDRERRIIIRYTHRLVQKQNRKFCAAGFSKKQPKILEGDSRKCTFPRHDTSFLNGYGTVLCPEFICL